MAQTDIETAPERKEDGVEPVDRDIHLVTWDSPDDPTNPRNWTRGRRWFMTLIVACFTLLSPLSSTMIAPSLDTIANEFNITSPALAEVSLSIFLIGLGLGPLVLSPLSEIYGRVPVLLIGNLLYLAWNTGCGFARSTGELLAFRLLSGIGASAPLAVGGGVISDLWPAEERGTAVAVYTFGPLLGPAIGPIAGGFITEYSTWRWVFWSASIADLAFQALANAFLRETFAPKLLRAKAKRLCEESHDDNFRAELDERQRPISKLLRTNLTRPLQLIGTQIVVQAMCFYTAYLYGIMFLLLFTYPLLWTNQYHQSIALGSLNYISMGIGYVLGSQVAGPLSDKIYIALKARNNGIGKPEFRIPLMAPASMLVVVGLLIFGWTGQANAHWILPNIGAVIFSIGFIVCFQSVQTYMIDAYTRYAASALSAINVGRSLSGFTFPLFAPYMYGALAYGWTSTVLAFVALGAGVVIPSGLWRHGMYLRLKSPFAAGD